MTADQEETLGVRRGQASRNPSAHGMLVHAENLGGSANRVAVVDFDAAAVRPPRSGYFAFSIVADVSTFQAVVR